MNSVYTIVSGGPPFGTAPTNHKLIPHEPRTTNNKKSTSRRPTYPAESRLSQSGCILSHHQVTRFGISDSHGFARRKAPLLTMHYVYITFQAGRPSGRPLRATNYEPQKSTDGRPTYPAESRLSLSGCILSHHQVTRFGISDSHGFARRKAPLLTMHYVYITFQAGRPLGRPLRTTNSFPTSHEPRTTNQSPPPVKRVARLTAISLCC